MYVSSILGDFKRSVTHANTKVALPLRLLRRSALSALDGMNERLIVHSKPLRPEEKPERLVVHSKPLRPLMKAGSRRHHPPSYASLAVPIQVLKHKRGASSKCSRSDAERADDK